MAFRLFSWCPRIEKRGSRLVASTPWKLRLLSLGMLYREVVVDPDKRVVLISRRYAWFFSSRRRWAFEKIQAITYGYQDLGSPTWAWAHDSSDLFRVGLRLYNGDEVHLLFFFGDGTFSNNGPLPDWLYWPQFALDVSGTQERESRYFVELLRQLIGVPIQPARY